MRADPGALEGEVVQGLQDVLIGRTAHWAAGKTEIEWEGVTVIGEFPDSELRVRFRSQADGSLYEWRTALWPAGWSAQDIVHNDVRSEYMADNLRDEISEGVDSLWRPQRRTRRRRNRGAGVIRIED